jgi:hypothetical protein
MVCDDVITHHSLLTFLLLRQKKSNKRKGDPKKMLSYAHAGARPLFWEPPRSTPCSNSNILKL